MAALADPRHETFALRVAQGASLRAAYRAAFPKGKDGYRLMRRPEIAKRVEALRGELHWSFSSDLAPVIERLTSLLQRAEKSGTAAGINCARAILLAIAKVKNDMNRREAAAAGATGSGVPGPDATAPAPAAPAPLPRMTREEWLATFAPKA